jgi:hypothetical protein
MTPESPMALSLVTEMNREFVHEPFGATTVNAGAVRSMTMSRELVCTPLVARNV